jgi:hypothetical protein
MATDAERIKELEKQLAEEKKKIIVLEQRVASCEISGKAKLYYSLNRNMSDLADMIDTIKLKDVNIDDTKDKTMERLKIIWAAVKPLSETLSLLGSSSGITGDEVKDTARKSSFLDSALQ